MYRGDKMAIALDLKNTNHKFEKQNPVTIIKGKKAYDVLKCSCGISGKRYGFTDTIWLDGRISKKKANNCPDCIDIKAIEIIQCTAVGKAFENLKPGTIHTVIDAPEGANNNGGVWVMGEGEPVKVLHREYKDSPCQEDIK